MNNPWTPAYFNQYCTQYCLSMTAANRAGAVDLYSRLYSAWQNGTATALELVSSEADVPGFLTTLGQGGPAVRAGASPAPTTGLKTILIMAGIGIAAWMYLKG
jgi:hypothetical protein